MKKLSVSKLIEFSRKSKQSQLTFIKNHNKPIKSTDGGGHYWISSISALCHAFENDDNKFITDKIEDLITKRNSTSVRQTKVMYQRNIDILRNFESFNFSKWILNEKLEFLNKNSDNSVIPINGVPVQIVPNHIFKFDIDGVTRIGGIIFVSNIKGYNQRELASFSDSIFRYLKYNYSHEFHIDPKLCLAIDMNSLEEISFEDIKVGKIISILDNTVKQVKEAV